MGRNKATTILLFCVLVFILSFDTMLILNGKFIILENIHGSSSKRSIFPAVLIKPQSLGLSFCFDATIYRILFTKPSE